MKNELKDFFDESKSGKVVINDKTIRNVDRCFGARLSYEVSSRYGEEGLPDDRTLHINLKGAAGQSFCAFLAKGVFVNLEGEANDYVGKVFFLQDKNEKICNKHCLGSFWRQNNYSTTTRRRFQLTRKRTARQRSIVWRYFWYGLPLSCFSQ